MYFSVLFNFGKVQLGFSVGAAISRSCECSSILTRVLGIIFFLLFFAFRRKKHPDFSVRVFLFLESSVDFFVSSVVREKLSSVPWYRVTK